MLQPDSDLWTMRRHFYKQISMFQGKSFSPSKYRHHMHLTSNCTLHRSFSVQAKPMFRCHSNLVYRSSGRIAHHQRRLMFLDFREQKEFTKAQRTYQLAHTTEHHRSNALPRWRHTCDLFRRSHLSFHKRFRPELCLPLLRRG
jgi:hypothetical protein